MSSERSRAAIVMRKVGNRPPGDCVGDSRQKIRPLSLRERAGVRGELSEKETALTLTLSQRERGTFVAARRSATYLF